MCFFLKDFGPSRVKVYGMLGPKGATIRMLGGWGGGYIFLWKELVK